MKLGEALTVRARQAQRLNDLAGRIKASALVQEGEEPPEDPMSLLDAYLQTSIDHERLVIRINKTNAQLAVDKDGTTMLDLLQQRERLIRERNIYGMTAKAGTPTSDPYRYSRSELKYVPKVNIARLRMDEENMTARINQLDIQIQQINWQTDLVD